MRPSRALALIATTAVGMAGVGVAVAVGPDTAPGAGTDPTPLPGVAGAAVSTAPDASPSGGEVRADLKRPATEFVERVGTWARATPPDPPAQVTSAGYPRELAATAGPLFDRPSPRAITEVVYPQLGGLTPTTASVIVVARQTLPGAPTAGAREVTLDVRLRYVGRSWVVSPIIDPPQPEGPRARTGGPSTEGRSLLASARADLPGPVRHDVETRRLGDRVIGMVRALARGYEIELQVAVSGHPGTVFPSTRLSNHAVGRAVDVRSINGTRVADIRRDDPLLVRFMVDAARAGATEVGGPIVPPGRGFFTDEVHQDHIHVGFTPGKPAAAASSS